MVESESKALKPRKPAFAPELGHCKAAGHGSAGIPDVGVPGEQKAPFENEPVLGVMTELKALLVEFAAAREYSIGLMLPRPGTVWTPCATTY